MCGFLMRKAFDDFVHRDVEKKVQAEHEELVHRVSSLFWCVPIQSEEPGDHSAQQHKQQEVEIQITH